MDLIVLFYIFVLLFAVFLITLSLVGFFLLYCGKKKKIYNLITIGIALILIPIGFVGNLIFRLGIIFENIFISTSFVLMVIFTNQTFHKKKNKTKHLVLCLIIILAVLISYLDIFNPKNNNIIFFLKRIIDIIFTFLTFIWLGWSSYKAYCKIKNNDIQPWIKIRYKIIAVASFIFSPNAILYLIVPVNISFTDFSNLMVLIYYIIIMTSAVIVSIGFCIAWMMPKQLKMFLNRNYRPLEDKVIPEDELMQLIKNQLIGGNQSGNN